MNQVSSMTKSRKITVLILFIAGALPLLVYPFVLLANIMGLAGVPMGTESSLLLVVVYAFIIISTAYPITYVAALIVYAIRKKIGAAVAPFVHLVVAILFFILWLTLE